MKKISVARFFMAHGVVVVVVVVFYNDFSSRWNHGWVISCYSQQKHNPQEEEEKVKPQSIYTVVFTMSHGLKSLLEPKQCELL